MGGGECYAPDADRSPPGGHMAMVIRDALSMSFALIPTNSESCKYTSWHA